MGEGCICLLSQMSVGVGLVAGGGGGGWGATSFLAFIGFAEIQTPVVNRGAVACQMSICTKNKGHFLSRRGQAGTWAQLEKP